MNGLIYRYSFFFLVFILLSCAKKDEIKIPDEQIVVEGYLLAGEPVNNIKISKIDRFGASEKIPLSDAEIKIKYNNIYYPLFTNENDPTIYASEYSSNLEIVENQLYQLEISYNGNSYTSSCTVPPSIDTIINTNSLLSINIIDPTQIVTNISWSAVPGYKYCVFSKPLDPAGEEIIFYGSEEIDLTEENPFLHIIEDTSITIKAGYFKYYGNHELYITAINPEYEEFYRNPNNQTFSTAPSNITNAWGIFTAFHGKKVQVMVQ